MSILTPISAALTGALGTMIGTENTHDTNLTNEKIAARNNAWQSAETEKSRQWQEFMWQKEQAYNTPSAQKERFLEAGINPFIDQSAIGAGETSSAPSPAFAPTPSSPSISPYNFSPLLNGLVSGAGFLLEKKKIDADAANQEAQTVKTYVNAAMDFYKDGKDDAGDKLLSFAMAQHGGYMKQNSLTSEGVRLNVEMQRIEKQSKLFEFDLRQKYGDAQANQLLSNMKMEYDRISSEKDLNRCMERLHDAELDLMKAKTDSERENAKRIQASAKAEIAAAAAAYSAAVASKSAARSHNAEASIKEESKKFLLSKLESEATLEGMRRSNAEADYKSEAAWRHAKQTETGQFITVLRNTVSSAAEAIGGVFTGSVSKSVK